MARVADCVYWVDWVVFLCMLTYASKIVICVENWEILRKKAMQAIIFTSAIACLFFFLFFFLADIPW